VPSLRGGLPGWSAYLVPRSPQLSLSCGRFWPEQIVWARFLIRPTTATSTMTEVTPPIASSLENSAYPFILTMPIILIENIWDVPATIQGLPHRQKWIRHRTSSHARVILFRRHSWGRSLAKSSAARAIMKTATQQSTAASRYRAPARRMRPTFLCWNRRSSAGISPQPFSLRSPDR